MRHLTLAVIILNAFRITDDSIKINSKARKQGFVLSSYLYLLVNSINSFATIAA